MRRLALVICVLPVACGSGVAAHGDGGADDHPAGDAADAADAASDVRGDVGADGTNADGGTHPYVYVAMASTALMSEDLYPTDIVMVDVAAGRAVLDTTLIGTVAMSYQDGKLLVARRVGYARVSVLNADTLAVERTQPLPWDPTAAVFSSDGKYLYAAHGDDGYVAQVRMADGVVTADLLVPRPSQIDMSVPNGITDVTISPSQKLLATTTYYGADGSGVGLIAISGETLSLAHQWVQKDADFNCDAFLSSPRFDHTNRWLSVLDRFCGVIDIYDVVAGDLAPGGSVQLADVTGNSQYIGSAEDSLGRFWAVGYQWLYWIDPTAPAQHGVFPIGDTAGILITDPARTLYLWNNPRVEGVFTIDPSTGNRTKLPWNLDLFSEQAVAAQAIWVER